ncbi:uncharacterized protein VTP21DRAFT_10124 [Calcarisporiella thermophila]|uniref:uncharacterized protein n=1 Tax=Calcarisporiella thermophila TaxID=911321 RepID=UPI003743EFCF
MPAITPEQLIKLQSQAENIRNICILAHVDHGKTTLSDLLLASNGIISPKLAGKVRYLDSREDEQERGITMEASGISLFFRVMRNVNNEEETKTQSSDYLINLIDAPGHVDFSSEVSTASRLCDGALVLVDVVEGVCTQTHTVLHQAWTENVRPVLVLNKIDRLITELQFSPLEAYAHLNKILEQVNAIVATFYSGAQLEEENRRLESLKSSKIESDRENSNVEKDEVASGEQKRSEWATVRENEDISSYFSPELGNVIFASAIDGWAFRIEQFAQLYSMKLGIKEPVLRKCLWGDYYLDPKTKRVLQHKHLKGRALKPMFVQFALENIWAVYDSVVMNPNREKVEKIVKALNIKVLPRDLRSKDTRVLLTGIFSQWLPLSTATLLTIVEQLPSPLSAQPTRLPRILHPDDKDRPPSNALEHSLYGCQATGEMVAYVSKMFAVPEEILPENKRRQLTAEEMRERGRAQREALKAKATERLESEASNGSTELFSQMSTLSLDTQQDANSREMEEKAGQKNREHLIGFARIYSGTISVGQKIYVLGPKYNPEKPDQHCSEVVVESLYLLMGRELESLQAVPAGNVFGIGGLAAHLLKNGTLSTSKACPNLAGVHTESAPIVRVALEPSDPTEMGQLVEGLRLLNQADPCVEVLVQETGEHVIMTAGELHLERCLRDLRERFAKIDIQVSPAIVPFREGIIRGDLPPTIDRDGTNYPRGILSVTTPNKHCSIRVRCLPLPPKVTSLLMKHTHTIQSIVNQGAKTIGSASASESEQEAVEEVESTQRGDTLITSDATKAIAPEEFRELLERELEKAGEFWKRVGQKIWAFGPKRIGPNVLANFVAENDRLKFFRSPEQIPSQVESDANPQTSRFTINDFAQSIQTGFQLATFSGPLCAEPMVGVCFIVEEFTVNEEEANEDDLMKIGYTAGQVISTMREACRQAFLEWSPRLHLAMYSCDIQATAEVLGKVYGVIARRRGRITSEEMKEGTPFFQIHALLPVVESFGFADEIRKRTSGAASPQLIFSGFEMLDQDPFWVPTTEEELEDLGEKADRENIARRYMDGVRKRKGMFVDKKIVEHAEKQRTLKKN